MKRALPWVLATLVLAAAFHVLTVKAYPYYVMLQLARTRAGAVNTITYAPRVTEQSRVVVRPSPDLLYSACGFDISARPLHLRAPVPEDDYWSVSGFAANTDNFFTINDRQLGSKEADIILIKAGDQVPAHGNARVVESPTTRGVVLFRMLIPEEDQVEELIKLQKMASCAPLD